MLLILKILALSQTSPTQEGNMIILENDKLRKSEICNQILRSLPNWFGIESAILDYVKDVQSMKTLIALKDNIPIGFLALTYHNKFTAEIHVMGVIQEFHRSGIGRSLIFEAEKILKTEGFKYISVKTLSESRPNKEYDQTRKFYFDIGFIPVEEFKTLWGEHNPCLLLIKQII